jgi:uncharacterized protein
MLIGAGTNEVAEGKGVAGVNHTSFVAAVWMLSSRKDFPSFVRGLFGGKDFSSRSKYGVHSVNLFVRGKWRVYTIDDFLPVDKDFNLIFTSAADIQHLWAPLLEKALAKSFGSYKELGKSSPLLIMHRLTGGLTETFRWAPAFDGSGVTSGFDGGLVVRSPRNRWFRRVADDPAAGAYKEESCLLARLQVVVRKFGLGSISKEEYLDQRSELLRNHGSNARAMLAHGHQKQALGDTISEHLDSGAVLGASCRSEHDHEDTGEVSRDHIFSIATTKVVQGVRFFGLRSRWGRTSWNSFNALLHLQHEESFQEPRWREAHLALHLEAALALRRYIGIELTVRVMRSKWHVLAKALVWQKWRVCTQKDPTMFWISVDAFVVSFNSLYILQDVVNRNLQTLTAKGQWIRRRHNAAGPYTAGGAWPLSKDWLLNPKFQLTVTTNKTKVRIVISCTNGISRQATVAFRDLQDSDAGAATAAASSSGPLAMVAVLLESVLRHRGPNLDFWDFEFISRPCNPNKKGQVVLPELLLNSATFVIIPMLLERDAEGKFRVNVSTSEQCFLRGRDYGEHLVSTLVKLTSMPTEIRPDPDSDWEESHKKDDGPHESAPLDLSAWGALAQAGKVKLHPKIAALLYKDDIGDMVPNFHGRTCHWYQPGSTASGDIRGGVDGWEQEPDEDATKAKVRGLLLRFGYSELGELATVHQELMGKIEVCRSLTDFHIVEHRVRLQCADRRLGIRSISARAASIGGSVWANLDGKLCFCDPLHADSRLRNMKELRGNIACILAGGTSSPQEKALRAFHAGVIGVVIINDSDDLYAISGDTNLAYDKSSNVVACVESRDAANDTLKVSLLYGARDDTFVVSRKTLILMEDLSIPVIMIGKTDGLALGVEVDALGSEDSTVADPLKAKAEKERREQEKADAHIAWLKETTQEERAKERQRLQAEERTRAHVAKLETQQTKAEDQSTDVSIIFETSRLLSLAADLEREARDPLSVNRIVFNLVGLSVHQFKDAVEAIFVSLQFYHYQDIRDIPVALEAVSGEASSGVYRLISMDRRFRSPNEEEGGVHVAFDLDPFNTGMEQDVRNDILASYLLMHNLHISVWAQTANRFFSLGVAKLPLFVLLRQQRESVLFQGSLPLREPEQSATKGKALLDGNDKDGSILHMRAVNVGLRPRNASAHATSGSERGRISSLLPASRVAPRSQPRQVLGIALPDHEVLQLVRNGLFYDIDAPLDRRNLPFVVEFRDLDGEDAGQLSVLDLSEVEEQIKRVIRDLSVVVRNLQMHGLPYPFPRLADLFEAGLIQDRMTIAFSYKDSMYNAMVLDRGATIEHKGNTFAFESIDKCVWDVIGHEEHEATDIGMAEMMCYAGTNKDQARSLASIYTEYCQHKVVGQLNRWIPFLRNCVGKTPVSASAAKQGKSQQKSKSQFSRSNKTTRLEANAWMALGVCAFMHWPLEQDIKHRKALRSGVPRDESRDKEIEWKAVIKATKYLERAADANHACARYNLGLLLEAGFESAQDMVAAQEWILLIASQRHYEKRSLADFNRDATPRPPPQHDSLDRLHVGCGSQADVARAHLLYAEAGRQGVLRAKCRTELRTIQMACSSADAQRAMQVLASGSQMDPAAMFGMGILHLFHMVQDSNPQQYRSRAFDCFRRASEQGHSRASFNAGICKQLGIGTEKDAAGARNFFRSGARRLEARCIEQLAVCHLETDFPHSHPSTGVHMLQDAWRLGHRRVASKLAALYSEGRAVKQNFELAAAWLAQGDQEVNKFGVLSQQGVAQHATFLQKAPISISIAMSIVKIHEAPVKETIKARLQEGGRRWFLRDVLRALVDRASLPYALASDVVTAIAAHNFQGSVDMDKMLEVESLNVVFPFMADTREQKDSFYGQQQLKQLYGESLLTRRLRVISNKIFTELSRNFSSNEDAFLRFSRPENRCHVLAGLSLKGLRPGQCDEHWQHRFSRFLECMVQVGLVEYERRKLEVSSLDQEFRLFRQGKPHALFLFDENDFDKRRGFGVPRMRSIVKSARRLIAKPALYGWHGKTLEAVKDPETRLTTYHDLSHPLSIPSAPGGPALSNQVHVGESDLHEMWAGRVGEGSQELYDRSVACGVLTEFGSETPDATLPPIEDYASRVLDDLEWARAHLRYGGTVVIPAPDIDPADQGGAAAGDSRQTVRHSLGRLLPQAYKAALQRELDELMVKACADAVSHRDRRGWLPKGSPFRKQSDDGDIQVCSIDILSQHAEYSGEASTMVLKLRMVTKNALEAQMVGRRLDSLIASGVLTDCLRMHCMPKAYAGSQQPGALSVELNGRTIIMHPVYEANMQQPFIDQPIKLNLLSLPNFMKMLSAMQVCGVCDEGCKERHFGKTCFACGKEYSEHEGHTCPDGGQGFFEVDRLPELIDAKRILFAFAGRGLAVSASDNGEVRSQNAAAEAEAGGSPDQVASDGKSAGKSAVSTSSAQSSEDGAASAPLPHASLESSSSSSVLEPPSENVPAPPAFAAESLGPESAATAKSLQPPATATHSRSPAATKSVLDASKGSEDVPTIEASSTPSQDSGLSKPLAPPQATPTEVTASPIPSNVFAVTARGVKWERVGSERPKSGTEIQNEALAAALQKKLVLSDKEWEKLNLTNLPQDCYIKVDGIYVRAAADDGVDEGAREAASEAAAKAAKLSAKRRRFMLAQTLQYKVQESNKENAYRPTGDIHGVDCRQFSSFFAVLTETADSVSDWTVVRREELGANMQTQEAGLISRMRALKEVQQFQKRNVTDLNRMVIEDLTKVRHWFPCSWDPASRFFKHELGNPYTNDVEVVISVLGQDLEVLTSAEEHAYCCNLFLNSSKTQSAPIPRRDASQDEDPDEQALAPYRAEDAEKGQIRRYSVALPRGRTVSIFFKYAGLPVVGVPGVPWQVPVKVGPSIEASIRAAQAKYWSRSKVAFHFRETALEILQLEIRPQPIVPSRNFRIYIGQGESKVGLLPFDKRESGKFVKIFSQAASPFIASADVLTKAACRDSTTGMFRFAYIDSGTLLTDSVGQDEADHGALRVFLDASECKDPGQHHSFFCILDRLGNLVAVWSFDVVVLKNYVLPDSHDLQLTVSLQEFAGDRMHQLSNSPANWQCLVSYFFGVEDGERSDVLQIADSTQKDSVCFQLKNLHIFRARQCHVKLIDKQSKLCYGSMRMLLNLKKDLARLPPLVQDAAQEQDVIDEVIYGIRVESSEDEQDVDEDRGAEPDAFEPPSDGDLYFEIIIAPEGLRKKSGIKIRINASEVLREDLHKVEELMRLKGEEQEVQPPEWKNVQRKLKKLAGVQSFVYSWRPGAQLTVKNERSYLFSVALCLHWR